MRVSKYLLTIAVGFCALPAFANNIAFIRLGTSPTADITSGVTYTSYDDFINNANGSNITPFTASYTNTNSFFADGTYIYRTNSSGGVTTSVTRYTSVANMATDTGGVESALSQSANLSADFFSDGTYYYKTNIVSNSHDSVTRYNSYADLLSNTAGQTFDFVINYYGSDEIFSDGTYYYRTNTMAFGNTLGISAYQSFANLLTDTSMPFQEFPVGDERAALDFFAIPVSSTPEPTTLVLLAAGAVLLKLKRKK